MLFLNGETEAEEEEEQPWVEEVIGTHTLFLRTALDDFNSDKKTLFATLVWNGARSVARHLFENAPHAVAGKSIVELGAGAGLPALMCTRLGATTVVVTDFPAPTVIANLQENVRRNAEPSATVTTHVAGFRWGDDPAPLLALNGGKLFDVAVCSECLWKADTHAVLAQSLADLLAPGGVAYVGFSHHHPGREDIDLSFFARAAADHHLETAHTHALTVPYMWSTDTKDVPFFIYELHKRQ